MQQLQWVLHHTQVLVVGGGAAGIRAAIESATHRVDTLLVVDGRLCKEGSTFYERSPGWGIMSATNEQDIEPFYRQVMGAANGCVNPQLVHILCEQSLERVRDLEQYGIAFTKLQDLQIVSCFGQTMRGAMLDDLDQCKRQLTQTLFSLPHVSLCEGVRMASLLVEDNTCLGAVGFDGAGTAHLFCANAVILACGGAQNLYQYAYRNGQQNGTAYAMAARRGARVVNLEFVQFINATVAPVGGINYYQFGFVTCPEVVNRRGEPFLHRYLPNGMTTSELLTLRASHGPFSVSDNAKYFDLAIVQESGACGLVGAKVTCDPRKMKTERYRPWRKCLAECGCTTATPMVIYPHCHAFNGGVLLHSDCHTDISRLFACGESAGGCHGANRMGGNSLLGTQVFGKLAGQLAAQACKEGQAHTVSVEKAMQLLLEDSSFCRPGGKLSPAKVLETVQAVMQKYAFLTRDEAGLCTAIQALERCRADYDPRRYLGLTDAGQAYASLNALCSALLILYAMRERRESRGGHYRTDYPAQDPTQDGMIAVCLQKGQIQTQTVKTNEWDGEYDSER